MLWHDLKAETEKKAAALPAATANLEIASDEQQQSKSNLSSQCSTRSVPKKVHKQARSGAISTKVAVESQSVPELKEAEVDCTNLFL